MESTPKKAKNWVRNLLRQTYFEIMVNGKLIMIMNKSIITAAINSSDAMNILQLVNLSRN
jgi:hypothetical protein